MEKTKKQINEYIETLIRIRDKQDLTWAERDILADVCNLLEELLKEAK